MNNSLKSKHTDACPELQVVIHLTPPMSDALSQLQ